MKLQTHKLAWAAGLFDGEGYITALRTQARYGKGKALYPAMHIEIGQVDRRVLDRFRLAVGGIGKTTGPYGPYGTRKQKAHRKPRFNYRANSFESVQAVVAMLWKWLSPVKKQQAAKALHKAARRPYESPQSSR